MCRHEAEGIKQIVAEISRKLQPSTSSVDENLIGMAARLQGLKSELEIGSGGKRMIGIWGVGGGGKTTLASSIYDEICRQFDGCCFVTNIREESRRHGLEKLEEDILSKMGVKKDGGRSMIKDRLRCRKVLIVLDDVDHLDQLKALAGSEDRFGEESQIIITTRDKHVLTAHKVNVIHDISLLSSDEAMKLFCKHAPRDNRSAEDYEHLSKEVVSYAGGLPLALTVLSSFLCDKDIDEWKSTLARLKEIPDNDIMEKLKISFDGLKPVEKGLFLDIACFFRREDKDEAMAVLDACGFHPVIGVKVLIQKALITISWNGRFDMHDLVQEMGHHIVRGEHPNNPEKHSRVWKEEDVLKICAMDPITELNMIQAIKFEYFGMDNPLQHLPPIVANTKNLRCIEWGGDLASPLLTNYPQRTLCCLILNKSSQKQLWEGCKWLPNLKTIKLHGLDNLIMTPDFSGLINLERFILDGCICLEEIHPSIGRLERLVFLSIKHCTSLKMIPPISGIKKLENLSFKVCHKLFEMENSPHLDLDNSGKEVASYKKSSKFFSVTWLTRCCNNLPGDTEVEKPPENLNDKECFLKESYLPPTRWLHLFHTGLRKLDLRWCSLGDEYIGSDVWELPNLEELDLKGNDFSRLSFSHLRLPKLKSLDVSICKKLVELTELPPSIAVVKADRCDSLESFGDISNCKWLWKVSLRGENKLYGDILLHSMFQGNAFEYHFISAVLKYQMIPKGWFVGRLFTEKTCTLHLPQGWYGNYCGFLICIVTEAKFSSIRITIKQDVEEVDSRSELWQEPSGYNETTFIGYVSFSSLRNTTLLTSSPGIVSFSIDFPIFLFGNFKNYVGAELVPRKVKVHTTADCSKFWDKDSEDGTTFEIQHDSQSSIKILWQPNYKVMPYFIPAVQYVNSIPTGQYERSNCVIC